ncbi:MAG: hypothetical protein IJQ86_01895 [Spirochaetia bacterium]|nr:hypothetical protein [Spirochaetia bacterium]
MGFFNLIWFVFFGWWQAFVFVLLSIVFSITIFGIPIGKSLLEFAKLSAFPYGKEVIMETELKGSENVSAIRKLFGVVANIIWLPIGLIMAIVYIISGLLFFITILGIPIGVVYCRSAKFVIWPIGAKVVSKKRAYASAVANELARRNNTSTVGSSEIIQNSESHSNIAESILGQTNISNTVRVPKNTVVANPSAEYKVMRRTAIIVGNLLLLGFVIWFAFGYINQYTKKKSNNNQIELLYSEAGKKIASDMETQKRIKLLDYKSKYILTRDAGWTFFFYVTDPKSNTITIYTESGKNSSEEEKKIKAQVTVTEIASSDNYYIYRKTENNNYEYYVKTPKGGFYSVSKEVGKILIN